MTISAPPRDVTTPALEANSAFNRQQRAESPPPPDTRGPAADPYRGVLGVLLTVSIGGAAGALIAGRRFQNTVMLDVAVSLAGAAGILVGVLVAHWRHARLKPTGDPTSASAVLAADAGEQDNAVGAEPMLATSDAASALFPDLGKKARPNIMPSLTELEAELRTWLDALGPLGVIRVATGSLMLAAALLLIRPTMIPFVMSPLVAVIAATTCLLGTGVAAVAAQYLADLDPLALPEGKGLSQGARVLGWILFLAALSVGAAYFGQSTVLRIMHYLVLAVNATLAASLLRAQSARDRLSPPLPLAAPREEFSIEVAPLQLLGSRPNILASVLDSAERQLGIDLRSTWALTVVRRGIEPLVIALCLVGWLSTSLTVVGVQEAGLVERFGVPAGKAPLASGLHLHFPWPIDQVYRIPVQRVEGVEVGHEGEEAPGPENVLWSVEHAPNEFTLVLGNGRDLITVDAAVQYRIVDARAWRYHVQNPGDALRALAYRAVMRNTVNRTLSEALSENVTLLAGRVRQMVQQDADSLGLGVAVLGFTVGGMHPPVPVASAYEAVVSAQISKVTTIVNAQVYRNQTLPAAQDTVLLRGNAARAAGLEQLALAAGEAWSFRTLESQYRAAPAEYMFRRRLETLEQGLAGRGFTVVDSRYVRDGGELWIVP